MVKVSCKIIGGIAFGFRTAALSEGAYKKSMKFERPQRLSALAELFDAQIVGDPAVLVTGLNDIGAAIPGEAVFADTDKYVALALSSLASVVIMPEIMHDVGLKSNGKALLLTAQPHAAINNIAAVMFSHLETAITIGIHSTSVIAPTAKVSENCSIGPYCIIGNGVSIDGESSLGAHVVVEDGCEIGRGCRIGPHTTIHRRCSIREDVTIGSSCSIGSNAFYFYKDVAGLASGHAFGSVEVESKVEIGAGCTIDRGISGNTFIGAGSKLDNQVHIGHDVRIGKGVLIAAQTGIAGYSQIGDDVMIRGQVGIMHRVRVGNGAVILGKSGVDQDVADNQTVFGIPALTRDRYAQRRRVLRKRIRKLEKTADVALGAQRELTKLVFQAIADEAGLEYPEIRLDHDLIADLGLDSLDRVELQMVLEDEFDVELVELHLDEEAFENLRTVRDVVNLVQESLRIKSKGAESRR